MALVTLLEPQSKNRQTVHRPTRCLYAFVDGDTGERLLQLDTLGTDDRQIVDKVSQSIQFNRDAAQQLMDLFRQVFPDLV